MLVCRQQGMHEGHWRRIVWWTLLALGLACLWALPPQPAFAQPPTCGAIIGDVENALTPAACQAFPVGNACLAARRVDATLLKTQPFAAPGNKTALGNINRMNTRPQKGAAVLLGGSNANPVKVLIFGDTATSPSTNRPNTVFTVRTTNGQPTCERTRSGMILQTPDGQSGTLVVNGVTINLGSTVYVVPGADLLFDQDPRIDRREGRRNPGAPLCSGFDSDCDFGDDSCSRSDRLVYGPFCREDNYSYIETGLYRVTLYGEGEVQAGATDYNITRDYEMMGTQRLSLPGSYTFCWDGLQDGGTGFETIVQARSDGAYVDHITLEYLGRDCSLRRANNPAAGMGSGEMGVLTVYNLEGGVGVELPDGQGNGMGQGERLRIYYDGDQPVAMDESPTDAPYILGSDLAQWAMSDGLPQVEPMRGGTGDTGTTPPSDPVVSLDAEVLYDDGVPYALRVEARAYDPDAGDDNGDGIDRVYFTISNDAGGYYDEHQENERAYCAFGGDSPCDQSISFDEFPSGDYTFTATAYTDSGTEASTSTTLRLDWGDYGGSVTPTEVPTIVPTEVAPVDTEAPYFGAVTSTAFEGSYCYGNSLTFTVNVDDNDSVADITLWWRVYDTGQDPPSFQAYSVGSGNGTFQTTFSDLNVDNIEVYYTATDNSGNTGSTGVTTVTGSLCLR